MGSSVGPLFEQLGIWDEFVNRAKKYNVVHTHKEDLTHVNTTNAYWLEKRCVVIAYSVF